MPIWGNGEASCADPPRLGLPRERKRLCNLGRTIPTGGGMEGTSPTGLTQRGRTFTPASQCSRESPKEGAPTRAAARAV
eukprot:2317254-Alexandrium_andersonii.AAC.1